MNLSERSITIHEMMNSSGVRFGTSGARGLVADMSHEVCFAYTLAFLKAISAESGCVAVSYTHLDVYKRQAKKTAGLTIIKMVVTGLVMAILTGTLIKLKFFGGAQ